MIKLSPSLPLALALLISPFSVAPAFAQEAQPALRFSLTALEYQAWMSPDVAQAWGEGYTGQGTSITFVDDFSSSSRFYGDLGYGSQYLLHGEWTELQGSLIAPGASTYRQDFTDDAAVQLQPGFNAVNLSYGMYAASTYTPGDFAWSDRDTSLMRYASGAAVIAKSAGNNGVAVTSGDDEGQTDFLNLLLIAKPSAMFVGALDKNGTVDAPAELASYSNYAGGDEKVQDQFLVVGVDSAEMGIAGTSFAAPVVAGYAAILGEKFSSATPTQITNQLLTTARQDTLLNYDPAIYGRGEASLSRALAPVSIR